MLWKWKSIFEVGRQILEHNFLIPFKITCSKTQSKKVNPTRVGSNHAKVWLTYHPLIIQN
jgi:hypothetical protein